MTSFNSKPREKYHNNKLFRQKCKCDSTSSVRTYRSHSYMVNGHMKEVTIFYPGPSCDNCGTPWKEVHD